MGKIQKDNYGEVGDKEVFLFTLTNGKGNHVTIINYGAIVKSWVVKNNVGEEKNIVAGYNSLEEYVQDKAYYGCIVGRYANRIAKGAMSVNGIRYNLACNNGENHLHGGIKGFNKKIWNAAILEKETPVLTLTYFSKDGEEGYPGNLQVKVDYSYTDEDELVIEYFAETDSTTHINLTNHCYFNLSGDFSNNIDTHSLQIDADYYTPVDAKLIPTGEIKSVTETPFDFRKIHAIKELVAGTQLKGYDHNYVLNKAKGDLSCAAALVDPTGKLQLTASTTEPGIQLYTGDFIDDPAMEGKTYAVCLETQHFPDTPNQSNFPTTLLKPGAKFYSKTIYQVTEL